MDFLKETDLLKIEDILPFFPDFVLIDHFKEQICRALEDYNQHIDELKQEMDDATRSAEAIRDDIRDLRNKCVFCLFFKCRSPGICILVCFFPFFIRSGTVAANGKCRICTLPLLTRQFYIFPCQHVFHGDCLYTEASKGLGTTQKQRVAELQQKLTSQASILRKKETDDAVVPAAGASRRFGSQKLLADIQGQPLLQHTVHALLDGGVARLVLVVAPHADLSSVTLLRDSRVVVVINNAPDRGMFSSIQTGLVVVPPDADVLVLPADMPFVRASPVEALTRRRSTSQAGIVCAHRRQRGHPILLPPAMWTALLSAPASTTLKVALAELGATLEPLEVDDAGVLKDVDVRDDLA